MDEPSRRRLLTAILDLHHALTAFDRQMASSLGLNATDHACLEIINREGSITPGELGRKLGSPSATTTGRLARLEQGGWITRDVTSRDRRSVTLSLSPARAEEITQAFAPATEAILDVVADDRVRIESTVQLLERIRDTIERRGAT